MYKTVSLSIFLLPHAYSVLFIHDYVQVYTKKKSKNELFLPGDNSETGVLDGVGECPGGRKLFDGEPLLEPLPGPVRSQKFIFVVV